MHVVRRGEVHSLEGAVNAVKDEGAPQNPFDGLRTLVDALVAINRHYIRRHAPRPIYGAGLRYGRTEEWDTIPALYARGFGDGKSLAAARIAELLEGGVDAEPVFRYWTREDGVPLIQILVRRREVQREVFEDPCALLVAVGAR